MTKDVTIVVGGGLTGLAAAVGAAQRGAKVIVAERSGELGGRGKSDVEDGFALNLGPHALYRRAYAAPRRARGEGAQILESRDARFAWTRAIDAVAAMLELAGVDERPVLGAIRDAEVDAARAAAARAAQKPTASDPTVQPTPSPAPAGPADPATPVLDPPAPADPNEPSGPGS